MNAKWSEPFSMSKSPQNTRFFIKIKHLKNIKNKV